MSLSTIAQRIINRCYRSFFFNNYKNRSIKNEQEFEERIIMAHTNPGLLTPLTQEEKTEVVKMWGSVLGNHLQSFNELALFKNLRGFDPRYISHYMYLPIVAHKLNNYHYTLFFEHKSLLGVLTDHKVKFPYCFIRCIDGELYDNEMHQLTEEQAIELSSSHNILILKDSIGSSGGGSIEKLILNKSDDNNRNIIKEAIRRRNGDFVVQQFINQHDTFARFNSTSLNTLRVTSLYLNGKFSTLSIALRMGKKGMTIDNWGGGGIIVGVNVDGSLFETGYDNKFTPIKSHNGVVFKDTTLSQIPSLLELLKEIHSTNFSLCKLIGWDITYDENNEPVIIELNSSQPGLIAEQVCTGPIFGDRTEEVVRYCAGKHESYNRSLFIVHAQSKCAFSND